MTHTEYIELTELLRKLTGDADILGIVFDKVEVPIDDPGDRRISDGITKRTVASDQAKQHPQFKSRYFLLQRANQDVVRAVKIMNDCIDGWVESNQARADQGHPVTADDRALYEAMAGFMSATEKVIKGVGRQYIPLRSRCRSWMDLATTWFPELYPAHVLQFLQSDHYGRAVGAGVLLRPLTVANGRIADLARLLADGFFTLKPKDFDMGNDKARNDRQMWDRVFKDGSGTSITAKQLREANKK